MFTHLQSDPCTWRIVLRQTAILGFEYILQNVGADYHMFHCLSFQISSPKLQLSSNRDLDLDTSLNVDDDLLDNLGRSVKTA
jgi:hypothetical protein